MRVGSISILDLRVQILSNAEFAYRGAYHDLAIITGSDLDKRASSTSKPELSKSFDSAIDMTSQGPQSGGSSSNSSAQHSTYGDDDRDHSDALPSSATPSTREDTSTLVKSAGTSTWAALIGYTVSGGHTEQQLVKTPPCGSEQEAFERLHEQLKSTVNQRMAFCTDKGISWDTAAKHVELLSKIPPGFVIKIDEKSGMLYVVDHVNKTTHWQMPGYSSIRTIRQVVPKSEALREAAEEASNSIPSGRASHGLNSAATDLSSAKGSKAD